MDLRQNPSSYPLTRPLINDCKRLTAVDVASQSRREQPRVAVFRFLPIIGMSWQQKPQQSASLIVPPVYDAGGDFPVHVLSLPGTGTNQDDGDGGSGDVVISDPSAYLVQRESFIVNVPLANGLVNELAVQCLHKPVLVLLVIIVKVADEDLVFGNLMRRHVSPLESVECPQPERLAFVHLVFAGKVGQTFLSVHGGRFRPPRRLKACAILERRRGCHVTAGFAVSSCENRCMQARSD